MSGAAFNREAHRLLGLACGRRAGVICQRSLLCGARLLGGTTPTSPRSMFTCLAVRGSHNDVLTARATQRLRRCSHDASSLAADISRLSSPRRQRGLLRCALSR
eukprot:gene9783-biopygen9226